MPDPLSTSPIPAAVTAALADGPAKIMIMGGIGAGKSTVLEAIRAKLRGSGRPVVTAVPGGDAAADVTVVVDDAHLLDEPGLRRLAELAADPSATIVVAAEAREHQPGLRVLSAALERAGSRITLEPLTVDEIARLLADLSGHPPPPAQLPAAQAATAGIPLLVTAVGTAPHPLLTAAIAQESLFALIERLRRLEQPELEALLVASLGTDLGAADLAAALDVPIERGQELIDRARGTGLVEPSHGPEFVRSVHRAAAQILGSAHHHEVETALLRTQLASSTLSGDLALELAEHGMRDDGLAEALRRHAARSHGKAALRARIHRAAVDAGAADLRVELADALALCADCPAAAALADELLAAPQPAERAAAVRIAASVAVHDGNAAQAAELFRWLGPYPDATVDAAAAIVHLATGDVASARAALAVNVTGPPTAAARAARSLADGLLLTVGGPYPPAAVRLGQALAGEYTATAVAMPDSPAALVALAALHSGDSVRAHSVISRAVRAGGEPVFAGRHRLLAAWVRMQDGQWGAAADLSSTDGPSPHGRDALWTAALRTAIARRSGDAGTLQTHWFAGMDALAEYSIDLFSLLPLGELWVAAARLRQQERLGPALDQAFAVLAALGDPPSWSLPLHWAGVHAGILANDPAAVTPHGHALAAAADHSPFAAALAAAGRTWLRVLAGEVEAGEVEAAVRGLAQFGLTSDATRLAGQAALQAQDPKVSALMLQRARDLKTASADTVEDGPQSARANRPRPVSTALSDREREVAELLLLGMPYRDIGAQLFISAKTVEHHVARIRRRLGADSRTEMLSMLRAMAVG